MAKGGKREGAGRPKGAKSKLQLADFLSEKEIQELVSKAKELAKAGDKDMLKFMLEQKFGKARQNIGFGEEGTGELVMKIINYGGNHNTLPVRSKAVSTTDTSGDR